ncbi:MAG: hypothetical protein WCO90_04115, partial [Planctomycetota bacterium]
AIAVVFVATFVVNVASAAVRAVVSAAIAVVFVATFVVNVASAAVRAVVSAAIAVVFVAMLVSSVLSRAFTVALDPLGSVPSSAWIASIASFVLACCVECEGLARVSVGVGLVSASRPVG